MGLLGKLIKTTIDVATSPISVAADIVTLGGAMTDRGEPYTATHLKCIGKDLVDVIDEAEKL